MLSKSKFQKRCGSTRKRFSSGCLPAQFICAVLAVGLAVGIYLGLGPVLGKEAASWLCMLSAAPVAIAGFFSYHGMNLEQFLWAFLKSELLCAGNRVFISENFHYKALGRKEGQDFD